MDNQDSNQEKVMAAMATRNKKTGLSEAPSAKGEATAKSTKKGTTAKSAQEATKQQKPKTTPKKPDIKGPRTKEKLILKGTNPIGRPTKFLPEIKDKILLALRGGNYIETAAAFSGVHKDTLYEWLKLGAAEEAGPYRDFSDGVEEALATGEMMDVQRVGNAAKDDWRAAAWRLERRHPKRWGRKEHIELTKPKIEDLSDEELLALLNAANAAEEPH